MAIRTLAHWAARLGFALVLLGMVSPPPVQAVTFDFNSINNDVNSKNGNDAIDEYMTAIWGSSVNVTKGARASQDAPEDLGQLYLGNTESYVGRGKDNLGNPDLANEETDTYLYNRWNNNCDGCDRITMLFDEEADGVHYFEVDWQIFPVTRNSNDKVDFRIFADGDQLFHAFLEGPTNPMRESGLLGVFKSTDFLAPEGGWHKLEFVDWNSAPVGIDNLLVEQPGQPVPEPGTLALIGSGLAVLGLRRRAGPPRNARVGLM